VQVIPTPVTWTAISGPSMRNPNQNSFGESSRRGAASHADGREECGGRLPPDRLPASPRVASNPFANPGGGGTGQSTSWTPPRDVRAIAVPPPTGAAHCRPISPRPVQAAPRRPALVTVDLFPRPGRRAMTLLPAAWPTATAGAGPGRPSLADDLALHYIEATTAFSCRRCATCYMSLAARVRPGTRPGPTRSFLGHP